VTRGGEAVFKTLRLKVGKEKKKIPTRRKRRDKVREEVFPLSVPSIL
jgi:hypothetical protein